MNREEAIQAVLNMHASSLGARTMTFIDMEGVTLDDCYLDLIEGDYNPQLVDGELHLELWFSTSLTGTVPDKAALATRENDSSQGKVYFNKLRVKVEIDRVYIDGRRIYVEDILQ